MLKRLFRWFWGENKPQDLHVHVHVHLTQGGVSVSPQISSVTSSRPERVKHESNEATASEIARMLLVGGMDKAIDKSGEAAISKDETGGVDDQLNALRRLKPR